MSATNQDPSIRGLELLMKPFGPEKISVLKKKYKDKRTGEYHEFELDYVGHADVTERLLAADPHWNWQPLAFGPEGLPVLVIHEGSPVGLWISLTVCGVTRIGYGSCEPGKPDAVKELIGDALRNAAMRFGVALALWSKTRENDVSFQHPEPKGGAPIASGAERSKPQPGEARTYTQPLTPEGVANAFDGKVEPFQTTGAAPLKILGVNVPGKHTLAAAREHLISFGKHKGKTLGQLLGDPDGRSYIEWMAHKTATEIREGKRQKIYTGDYLVLLAFDSFQSTAPLPADPVDEGNQDEPPF